MSTPSSYPCVAHEIQAALTYALPNPHGTPHRARLIHPGSTTLRSNYVPDVRSVRIQDIRGREGHFSLDTNGFEFIVHPTAESFGDDLSIRENYYEEMRQLVMEHTGAHSEPAFIVHTDRTPDSVIEEVKKYLGEESERLLQGRVRFINAWRPIEHTVHHEPLAIVDWQTSSNFTRLFPLEVDPNASQGVGYNVLLPRFNANHSWYFLRHQNPSEVLMMKFYDSDTDGIANYCLHSSFRDLGCHVDAPRRRSIEVNMLVFG
ncbi:methyltransferase domain protein [Ceratobasidium sp. AG-Ba]|nr:methyltransferase domain protein [Ceratobasidium sp. AG-Ba]QRV91819.1 methyltransferase domain protein [Ceratobasidium sp. AG-Ba]